MANTLKGTQVDRARRHEKLLRQAREANGGTRDWRDWKASAAAEVVVLANETQRMKVLGLSLEGDLRFAYAVDMPAPRWPLNGRLVIGEQVVFDLIYQESWRWESPPSFLPLGVIEPFDIFHPNCRPSVVPVVTPGRGMIQLPRTMVCLGQLPPGTPPKEIVLLGYFAVSLQDRVLDEQDPEGVFNPAACQYYRDHPEYLPLTRAGLLDPYSAPQKGGKP